MKTETPTPVVAPSTGKRPIPITRESFTQALHLAVIERGPDFVYPDEWRDEDGACQYFVVGVGGACVIGKALEIMGYSISRSEWESTSAGTVLDQLGVYDMVLRSAAMRAQGRQDDSEPWGQAEQVYLEVLGAGR